MEIFKYIHEFVKVNEELSALLNFYRDLFNDSNCTIPNKEAKIIFYLAYQFSSAAEGCKLACNIDDKLIHHRNQDLQKVMSKGESIFVLLKGDLSPKCTETIKDDVLPQYTATFAAYIEKEVNAYLCSSKSPQSPETVLGF